MNIISLILVLTIWWCPCVESSPVLLEGAVCYDQCVLLATLCWPLPCFILYSKAKFACYSRYLLTSFFCIPVPYYEDDIFVCVCVCVCVVSRRSCRSLYNCSISVFSAVVVGALTWVTVTMSGLPRKGTKVLQSFLMSHQVLHFGRMMATPFLLRDSCPQ